LTPLSWTTVVPPQPQASRAISSSRFTGTGSGPAGASPRPAGCRC
jgi:hypothetical protein